MSVRAVLFDWRGTLACDPEDSVWLKEAAGRTSRTFTDDDVARASGAIAAVSSEPEWAERLAIADCSTAAHRQTYTELFLATGLDDVLAEALYELDLDPAFQAFYPDVKPCLRSLSSSEIQIAVVSDVHFDLRPVFEAAGLAASIDAFVLSFEHGVQKPDPAIFHRALRALSVSATDTLMVGDHPRRDGGAATCGITTVLLPPLRECTARGLDRIVSMATA